MTELSIYRNHTDSNKGRFLGKQQKNCGDVSVSHTCIYVFYIYIHILYIYI
jgi:hypothetical protein